MPTLCQTDSTVLDGCVDSLDRCTTRRDGAVRPSTEPRPHERPVQFPIESGFHNRCLDGVDRPATSRGGSSRPTIDLDRSKDSPGLPSQPRSSLDRGSAFAIRCTPRYPARLNQDIRTPHRFPSTRKDPRFPEGPSQRQVQSKLNENRLLSCDIRIEGLDDISVERSRRYQSSHRRMSSSTSYVNVVASDS